MSTKLRNNVFIIIKSITLVTIISRKILFSAPIQSTTKSWLPSTLTVRQARSRIVHLRVARTGWARGRCRRAGVHSASTEVSKVRSRHTHFFLHAVVENFLCFAAVPQSIIPRALVHTITILIELMEAIALNSAENAHSTPCNLSAELQACSRIHLLLAAEYELVVDILAQLTNERRSSNKS